MDANQVVYKVIDAIQTSAISNDMADTYEELAARTLLQIHEPEHHEQLSCMVARLMLIVANEQLTYARPTYSLN
jgi:hypothetical protein